MMVILIGIFTASFDLLAEMAPYLLFGILAAGVLHLLLPTDWVARGLGRPGIRSALRAALIGVPLPLCSCSVVPVSASLKKSGASNGAVVSFLVTTPTSGVDSIFATYSLLGGVFAVMRVISSFVIGLAAGVLTAFLQPGEKAAPAPPKPERACGIDDKPAEVKKPNPLVEALSYGFVELLGGMAKSLALGILLGGVVSYFLPAGFLEHAVGKGFVSYLAMMAFGIPLYVCASGSIPLAASLLAKGISPGAALVFLIAGPATNAAVITVISKMIGKKALAIFLATLALGSLIAGAALDGIAGLFPLLMPDPAHQCAHDRIGVIGTVSGVAMVLLLAYHLLRPLWARAFAKKGSPDMFKLRVPDMTCQHCVGTITKAVTGLPGVKGVSADPATKIVALDLDESADTEALIKVIAAAGYSPEKT